MALKKKVGYLSVIPAALLFTACGGGGDTTPTTPVATSALTGTVPGTIIQGFCADGSNPSVSSIQNGTDQHPFTLNLPTGVDCRIVMITNEGTVNQVITGLTFNGNPVVNMQTALDLGHVPLAMNPNDAVDINGDGFAEINLDITSTSGVTFNTSSNYLVPNGRLLASQCFQCHGTNGRSVNGWDSIAGESYGEILEELAEYPTTHIMGAQSVGYTLAERQALAAYLSSASVSSYTTSSTTYTSESDYDDDHDDDERDDD